jgi:hypothetical protein
MRGAVGDWYEEVDQRGMRGLGGGGGEEGMQRRVDLGPGECFEGRSWELEG